MKRIEIDVALPLAEFFGCTLDDLVEMKRVRVRK
jgi:hypothetical protein